MGGQIKKFVLLIIGSAMLLQFIPAPVLAADAHWVDHSTIRFDGNVYFDAKTDDDGNYLRQDQRNNECVDEIFEIRDNGTKAIFIDKSAREFESGCSENRREISLGETNKRDDYFIWRDKGTIVSSDEDKVFLKDGRNFKQENDSRCIDSIDVDPGASNGQLTLRLVSSNFSSDTPEGIEREAKRNGNYQGNVYNYPFEDPKLTEESKNNIGTGNRDCYVFQPVRISIGRAQENAGKEEGSNRQGLPVGAPEDVTDQEGECEGSGVFGWFLCPLLTNYLAPAVESLINGPIQSFLFVEPITENDTLESVWRNFRNIANVLFVVLFLVIIFSQASSIGLDSYSVKKMLPRLVIAAIGVQLSFFLTALVIDIFNTLGKGVYDLIISASGQTFSFNVGSGITGSIGQISVVGAAAAAAVFYIGIPALLMGGLILMLAIFATLSIRLLLIFILVIASPLALVMWVLPNTESFSRRWLSYLGRALVMYPMIMALFAMGGLASVIATNILPPGNVDPLQAVLAALIGIIAYFAPLFLIPFTFRFAGGALAFAGGAIMGAANRQARGRIGKSMEKKGEKRADFAKRAGTDLFREGSRWDKLTGNRLSKYGNVAARSISRPTTMWSRRARRETDALRMAHANEAAKEMQGWGISNHDALNALAEVGADGNAMRQKADAFRKADNHTAADQLESAFRLSRGRESHRSAALLMEASAGKLADDGSSIKAIDSFGGSKEFKAALTNQLTEMATGAGQWEFSRGTVGVDDQGRTFSQFHSSGPNGLDWQKRAAERFNGNVATLSDSDFYRMKTSSPKHIARAINQNIKAAAQKGDIATLQHAAQQAAGLMRVGSPDAQAGTLQALDDVLDQTVEAVATDASGQRVPHRDGGVTAAERDAKGNVRRARTLRDMLGSRRGGVDPLTDQLIAGNGGAPSPFGGEEGE